MTVERKHSSLDPPSSGAPYKMIGWQIYDYVEVQSVHNATFAGEIPPAFIAQARDLANWHEYYVFSSPDPKSIGTGMYKTYSKFLRWIVR